MRAQWASGGARLCVAILLTGLAVGGAPSIARAGDADADTDTLVLGPAAEGRLPRRYVERVHRSLVAAAAELGSVTVGKAGAVSATCAADAACLAKAGAAAGATRVVGVVLQPEGDGFQVVYLAVDVDDGQTLERHVERVRTSSGLRRAPGEALVGLIERLADGGQSPAAETPVEATSASSPLVVEVAGPVTGDGRTPVAVNVTGGPERHLSELRSDPEVPRLECAGAAALAATRELPPALLAPAVEKKTTLSCAVQLRGQTENLSIEVRPPAGPGLFASRDPAPVVANGPPVELRAFTLARGGPGSPPRTLRAAASSGTVAVGEAGRLALQLPDGRAPRMIAVAMASDDAVGAVFVPVMGTTKLPVKAERGSTIRVRIAGTWSDARRVRGQKIELPIAVPPGVERGVVRANLRGGGTLETAVDLNIPGYPRLAAAAPDDAVTVGRRVGIAVAVIGANGRPAERDAKIAAAAQRGEVTAPRFLGGGLWVVDYTAPRDSGPDRIDVRVDGDPAAGSVSIELRAVADRANRIDVDVANEPLRPGDAISGTVTIRDERGNAATARAPEVTLAGSRMAVQREGERFQFRGVIPDQLPDGRVLPLVALSNDARGERAVRVRAGAPATAKVRTEVFGRLARVVVSVVDRHGNLVEPDEFAVRAPGAKVGALARRRRDYATELRAHSGVRAAELQISAGGRDLARERIRFGPPRRAFVLGAYGDLGWATRQRSAAVPRIGVGLGLHRWLGPVELSLLVGPEVSSLSEQSAVMVNGVDQEVSLTLDRAAVPLTLRGRLPLSLRFGVGFAVAVVPERVRTTLTSDFRDTVTASEMVTGVRGRLEADLLFGARRLRVAAAYGRARLADGPVVGGIDGFAVSVGYEWWFADLGP